MNQYCKKNLEGFTVNSYYQWKRDNYQSNFYKDNTKQIALEKLKLYGL